ncbi:hypothetical protein B6S09_05625 [Oceanimonas baumannii]|uniref:Uncharacterized protein n=1 Tax=Oceanimonas baumannii TaxID=129578 RepID=A0A235CLB9_9GAMM|nr:hypothetical protein B6S09_05625 [Oceanimonas baumannii]
MVTADLQKNMNPPPREMIVRWSFPRRWESSTGRKIRTATPDPQKCMDPPLLGMTFLHGVTFFGGNIVF